jgi:hypothetical protein
MDLSRENLSRIAGWGYKTRNHLVVHKYSGAPLSLVAQGTVVDVDLQDWTDDVLYVDHPVSTQYLWTENALQRITSESIRPQ